MPYARIAELLRQKYNLSIQRVAVFKFIKVRARGRKVYSYRGNKPTRGSAPRKPAPAGIDSGRKPAEPIFEFKFSDRYNLTRLPPEEAAARRKKLEEEGH
jgi:hypothetical protein